MAYHLFKPDSSFLSLIKDYQDSFKRNNETNDGTMRLSEYDDLEAWLAELSLFENEAYLLEGFCNSYQYAYGDENMIVGMINIRTNIERSPFLRMYGGHIGYAIRKELRGKGFGKRMLEELLCLASDEFGLKEVMVTCLKGNTASRRLIESVGGKYLDMIYFNPEKDDVLRYIIELSALKK